MNAHVTHLFPSTVRDRIQEGVRLAPFTTFRIGGKAQYFFVASSTQDIVQAVQSAKEADIPFFLLGGGSNILVSDNGFPGLVIKNEARDIQWPESRGRVIVDAGVSWGALTFFAHKQGYTGLEPLMHIPGTLGGAVRGNAGSFGKETKDILVRVHALRDGILSWIGRDECEFSYRESIFKKKPWVIVQVELQLEEGDVAAGKKMLKKFLERRRMSQPLDMPCPGCFFKNPEGLFASKLIDDCGLKGFHIGQVRVSQKHANFIENLGGGTAAEVDSLVGEIKKRVQERFNVTLKEEVVRVE